MTRVCSSCGGELYPEDRFCVDCGTAAQRRGAAEGGSRTPASPGGGAPPPRPCPRCGADLHGEAGFCSACGARLVGSRSSGAAVVDVQLSRPDPWTEVRTRLQQAVAGEYAIERELGRGGMAAVFLARELAPGRLVAIKVMAPGLLAGPGMVERFAREAATVAALDHPHIVRLHTVRRHDDLHFFVMQYVDGRSLRDVLRAEGRLPVDLAQAILYQVGTALAFAHHHGVVNRDVKPANVLLDREGHAVVTDFGIAKIPAGPKYTQTGTALGTPPYMSPEQCHARAVTSASDQYSLGVVAWEMLVGRPPFAGHPYAIMQAHAVTPPPRIRGERPECPAAVETAVLRMLAKRPADRFASLPEALAALGAGAPEPGGPVQRRLAELARRPGA